MALTHGLQSTNMTGLNKLPPFQIQRRLNQRFQSHHQDRMRESLMKLHQSTMNRGTRDQRAPRCAKRPRLWFSTAMRNTAVQMELLHQIIMVTIIIRIPVRLSNQVLGSILVLLSLGHCHLPKHIQDKNPALHNRGLDRHPSSYILARNPALLIHGPRGHTRIPSHQNILSNQINQKRRLANRKRRSKVCHSIRRPSRRQSTKITPQAQILQERE